MEFALPTEKLTNNISVNTIYDVACCDIDRFGYFYVK
jgi:hypothetical protein